MGIGTEKNSLLGAAGNTGNPTENVEYLIVGRGGSAPKSGGGGGGYRTNYPSGSFAVAAGTDIVVTVGGSPGADASNGVTTFSTLNASRGGNGSAQNGVGSSGGSGGGGSGRSCSGGGSGTAGGYSPSEGNTGGTGAAGVPGCNANSTDGGWGGGGGAGASGGNGGTHTGGNGGNGLSNSITGSAVTYAGGGGGFADPRYSGSATGGTGGSGGGGNGSPSGPRPGTDELGGGGGGHDAGGGSGIVIIAYVDTFDDLSSVDVGLTVNGSTGNTTPNTSRSGYKVYRFTAGTGNIKF